MRYLLFAIVSCFVVNHVFAQGCCSGGSGSPIVGDVAAGVLLQNQMELSLNYQYNYSEKFLTENRDTAPLFENLHSSYIFFRTDYGITKKLTLSVSAGYYPEKSLVDKTVSSSYSSKGFGDLIIFPRYNVYRKNVDFKRTEITLGMGWKLPLGTHQDSTLTYSDEWIGDIYQINPPTVQTTTGSQDLMFYSLIFRDDQKRKVKVFVNSLYIRKSYNSLGIKFGDYSSVGLFVAKNISRKWGIVAQMKWENIGKIKAKDGVDLLAEYNIDEISTGSHKVFFVPQISYSTNGATFFASADIPDYQYLNGTQVGSEHLLTFGMNYRFLTKQCESVSE